MNTTKTSFEEIFPNLCLTNIGKNGKQRYEQYDPCEIIGQGGYGVVIKIKAYNTSDVNGDNFSTKAMKLLKPNNTPKREKIIKDFLSEIETLSKLEHPNLPRIYDWGEVKFTNSEGVLEDVPFYVMEFVEGKDLQKRINNNEKFTTYFFKELIFQTLSALKCCYSNPDRIIHLDIKPDNILVVENENVLRFVLTDFGKAKLISELSKNKDRRYDTAGGGIYKYVDPRLRPHLKKDKVPIEVFEEQGSEFDMYSIGRVYEDVYRHTESFAGKAKELNPWFYLINDLCWNNEENFEIPQLNKFNNPVDAFRTVERIREEKSINALPIRFQNDEKGIALIRISEGETVPFPKNIQQYVDTPEFQKLRMINQLGETDLVYPGATHTRFLHSNGTFYRALFYISSLQHHPLFNYLYDEDDIENLLLTSLLHDIGHYPFAHYFEEMDGLEKLKVHHETLSSKLFTGKNSIKKSINKTYSKSFLKPIQIKIIKSLCKDELSIGELIEKKSKLKAISDIWEGKGKYRLLKDIISGPIDSDKLDYLLRDSKQTGVPYGKMIDLERFFYSLTLNTENLPDIRLAVTAKGKSAVESIISARYNLFSEVYWHKTCRSATAMIKDALWYAQKNISQDEFEWAALIMGDNDFLIWLSEKIKDDEIAIDLIGGLKIGFRRSIYKRFRTYSKDWKEESKQESYDKFIDKLGNNFSVIHAYKNRLVKQLNDIGKSQKGWRRVKNHHLIIDIPNVKQDKYSSLKIKYPPSVEGRTFYDLKDISGLSNSIYDSFSSSTKKVRLFCHPDFFEQLISLKKETDFAISEAFKE